MTYPQHNASKKNKLFYFVDFDGCLWQNAEVGNEPNENRKTINMTPTQQAQKLMDTARELGFSVTVRNNSILTVSKRITPSCKGSFADADMSVWSVLECLPRTGSGSDWGTDGGSIGGMSAMQTGKFQMNRSGGSKRVLKALSSIS